MSAAPPSSPSLYVKTTHCRACGNPNLISILDLGEQALTGRFPAAGEPDPPAAPLELLLCDVTASKDACGLVQLGHTCDLSQMYGVTYGYRSSITQTMIDHLHGTAERVLGWAKPQAGDWLLEIGSNDGTMQNYLSSRKLGINLVATDPSAGKFAANYPKDSRLIVDFFSKDTARAASDGAKYKAIVSIAMFYDLERPLDFMRDVRELLAADGVWCFEQAYVPAMISSLCYDTICHEHLCYYSLTQINWMAKRAGLRLLDITMNDINGGSFTVFACRDDASANIESPNVARVLAAEDRGKVTHPRTWEQFKHHVRLHRARIRTFFEDARAAGDLVLGLGASTKGNVVLQYADIDARLMPAIGERDPKKFGLRTPRTGIPIISEEEARKQDPRYFVVFPWHFRNEIVAREKDYLARGGRLVFPLPKFEVVSRADAPVRSTNISWAAPMLFADERAAIAEALDSTMISGGSFVEDFETRFAAMHGAGLTALTTSNGTTALQLAYLALGIGPGDEIIVPGWGFMAAANMALAIGAKPVFADVDPDTWLLDPAAVKVAITPKTKAIVAIHTYGNVCDLDALANIARGAGVALIEDCAESIGSRQGGRICGTVGDIATFSFQATKLITSGEGGAILTRSTEIAERARLIRSHGMTGRKRYWHHVVGHNMRLPNILAAMLCAQLGHWSEITAARARLRKGYELRLAGSADITLQRFPANVEPIVWAMGLRLAGWDETARDRVIEAMDAAGIECRPGFYPPSAQPIYGAQPLAHSDAIAAQVIVPPIDPRLGDDALDRICDALLAAIADARPRKR